MFGVSTYGAASYAHSGELTKHELLTAREEIHYAEQVQLSLMVKKSALGRDLEPHERKILARGDAARNVLLVRNMRLVFHIAKYYRFRGLSYPDLVSEGTFGLMRAISKYDPTLGFRFSTYASHWVKQAVTRSVAEKSRLVRVPVNIHDLLMSTGRVEREFRDKFGRKPMAEELAARLGLPLSKVLLLQSCSMDVGSMDEPLTTTAGARGFSAKDRIASGEEGQPSVQGDRFLLLTALRESMKSLSQREARIIELRFGLTDERRPLTLEQVGKIFGITRERVRQLEAGALRKMRDPSMAVKVRDVIAAFNAIE